MKRYKEYMDSVEVSPELHEKLMGLDAPKRTPSLGAGAPAASAASNSEQSGEFSQGEFTSPKNSKSKGVPQVRRTWGALAAALVLVIGLGAWGFKCLGLGGNAVLIGIAEIADDDTDLAQYEPGGDTVTEGGDQTDGGYELTSGEITSFYLLPAIIFNEETVGSSADYSLAAPGSESRKATLNDVKTLLGGADMSVHLLWSEDWTWGGTLWFSEDESPCAASLYATGDEVYLSVELMEGSVVPDCIVYQDEDYERTQFQGVEITALKNMGMAIIDGVELNESRELSFYAKDMGCKLTIYGTDGDEIEAICARFARWGIVEGFDLAALSTQTEP